MNLTLQSDYSLRVLLFLAGHRNRKVSTQEISDAYGISRNHLVRVVQRLQKHSFVVATTGRNGGVTLARDPAEINIGAVVRATEPNFRIVECFDLQTNTCRIAPVCKLRRVLSDALKAFVQVLDQYTLADFMTSDLGHSLSDFLARSEGRVENPPGISVSRTVEGGRIGLPTAVDVAGPARRDGPQGER